jgi:hypothetical protein
MHRYLCIECNSFLVCFCFSPVGSGVDVSNESDVKIDNIDDQYLSINEQVKKENPGYLFYLVINNKASSPPPSEPMFQRISKLTILYHTVQLSFIDS